jgi:hypothetical protein
VLDDLDADRAIPFAIGAGQLARFQIYRAKRQLAPLKNPAAMSVRFQTKPVMPGRH